MPTSERDKAAGKNKKPDSLLQSQRLPLDGKFLECHILSQGCQQLAGVTFTRVQTQRGPCLPLGRLETRSNHKPFPFSLRLPVPFPRVQAVAKGFNEQGTGVGEETGRLAGPKESLFSFLPLPPKWLVLEGDLELCGGPMWFAKGGVGGATETHTHTHTHIHARAQPRHPYPQPGLGDILAFGLAWAFVQLVLNKWLLIVT